MTKSIATYSKEDIRRLVTIVFPQESLIKQESVVSRVLQLMDSSDDHWWLERMRWGFQNAAMLERFRDAPPMLKVDKVGEHQERMDVMSKISGHLLRNSFPSIDFRRLGFMCQNHDISEGFSPLGDIPTNIKATLAPDLQNLLDAIEGKISHILARFDYVEYYGDRNETERAFLEILEKKSIEGWVMKWLDIVDAYMVTLRELEAGNLEFSKISDRYREIIRNIRDGRKYPKISALLDELKFSETEEELDDLFGDDEWLRDHFLSSFELFRVDDFIQDYRLSDGSLRFPLWYSVWKEKIDQRVCK